MQKNTKRMTTEKLTMLALLTALQVVLGNLTQVPFIGKQFNFGFLPIIAAGALLGPLPAAIVGGLGDFIGAHLFPAGAYFPGFTLTSAIVGVLYGLPLFKQKPSWFRAAIAAALGMIPNLFLNSLWLSMLYSSKTYWVWVTSRAVSYLVEIPVQVVLIYLCLQGLSRMKLPSSIRLPRNERVDKA
ncbi:MAG: folate family ECF transporter S component [Clostridia bacterium]|nr:folate family ECF transporter S component [Clostridia bacterium]